MANKPDYNVQEVLLQIFLYEIFSLIHRKNMQPNMSNAQLLQTHYHYNLLPREDKYNEPYFYQKPQELQHCHAAAY